MRGAISRDTVEFIGFTCRVEYLTYQNGGTALQLIDAEDDSPVATATVWVPGLDPNEVAIKNYGENMGLREVLEAAGFISHPHRYIPSGFVQLEVCYPLANWCCSEPSCTNRVESRLVNGYPEHDTCPDHRHLEEA